ncbi:hypothetical protein KAW64_15235 [bacterium]|nr:hypothetical protein [bacterium]
MNRGFVYLERSVRDTWVWKYRLKEWVDLRMRAAFLATTIKFSGYPVKVRRGQYATTYRKLAERWGISLSSVKLFLDRLEEDGRITRQPIRLPGRARTPHRTPDGTLITIINYDPAEYLRGSENAARNVDPNAGQHIEEVSDKKKAAAAVQYVCEPPAGNDTAASGNSGASEIPRELGGIFDLLCETTQVDRDWPADQISEMIELATEVGWPVIREHVERVAVREMKRGRPPKSLRYYIKATRDDAGRRPGVQRETSAVVSAGASTREMPSPGLGQPQSHEPYRHRENADPELGPNFEHFWRQFGEPIKE